MKKSVLQMILATVICAAIVIPSMVWVANGTKEEQAKATTPKVTTTVATTATTAQPVVTLYYYDSVPLDKDLQDYIIRHSWDNGIDPTIVMALIQRESRYKADTIGDNGNSFGLCQIQPRWHYKRMQKLGCTDLLDPYQNVEVGVDYLCELLNIYGDMEKALTAYNRGHYAGVVTEYATDVMERSERFGEMNVYTR